jgi:hypothetical protein
LTLSDTIVKTRKDQETKHSVHYEIYPRSNPYHKMEKADSRMWIAPKQLVFAVTFYV